jgi:RimJ/RimL family protein N-acetyltransferase
MHRLTAPIETDRLLLREFTLDDVEPFLQLATDPQIIRYTGDPGGLLTLEDARQNLLDRPIADYAKHGFGRWACVLKESGQVIGFAGLKFLDELQDVDLGYRLLPQHWGKGLATEACGPIVRYGFDLLKLSHILGLVDPANVASVRVLEKLGMKYVEMIETRHGRAAKYLRVNDGGRCEYA